MEKRVLFAFILSLGVLLLFQYFQVKNQPVKPQPTAIPVQSTPANETQTSQTGIPQTAGLSEGSPIEKTLVPESKKVIIETDLYRAIIDTRGGRLTSLALKHYIRKKKPPFQKEDEISLETIPQGAYYPFEIQKNLTLPSVRTRKVYLFPRKRRTEP